MKGITPQTEKIIEPLSQLACIRDYTLVGGTALAIQLGNRESEDLDFMSWRKSNNEKREVDWPRIKKELESIGKIENIEILDFDHVEFLVNGVKISFYANPNKSPLENETIFLNNIKLADPISIGAMKMEVLLRRSKFRDYYDIFSLLESGADINIMIDKALRYSNHKLKSKNLIAILTRSERFSIDASFANLNPIYSVNPKDIEDKIRKELSKKKEDLR